MPNALSVASLSLSLAASLLAGDPRNTATPDTNTPATFTAPADLKTWETRKAALRRQILAASGLLPLPARTPLNPIVFDRIQRNGYSIEKVALETMPGYWLGGNLYSPTAPGPHPAVLHPHGHWTYGRLENSPNYSAPTLAINLARRGFVVFAFDMVGYTDTLQTPHDFSSPQFQLWSFTPLGLQLWNSLRAADYLLSLPSVDPNRLAMTGASGGGSQTFLLTAVDPRIAVSAPVNMISGIMQGGCVCENAPSLRIATNNVEIAAMMAPRPMLAVSATGDWTRNVPNVEFPAIQKAYALYGKTGLVEAVQIDAPHNYQKESREAVYEFLRKHLTPAAAPFKESAASVERLQDMLVWSARPLPSHARSFDELFTDWKARSRAQSLAMSDAELRDRLRLTLALHHGVPASAVPTRKLDGRGPAVLYLHPDGIDAALASDPVKKLRAAGRAVILIDAFQTGAARAPRNRAHQHFLTFNVSDDAARVADAVAVAEANQVTEIQAEGNARWWALFAAAAMPSAPRFDPRPGEFDAPDDELARTFFVPGLQRAGGAPAALRILSSAQLK